MNETDFSPRSRLLRYLDLFVKGEMDAESFCGSFEQVYNLELNKADLDPVEAKVLASLFEKVAWFSPIETERQQIPNYVGERDVLAEAKNAHAAISTP